MQDEKNTQTVFKKLEDYWYGTNATDQLPQPVMLDYKELFLQNQGSEDFATKLTLGNGGRQLKITKPELF